MPLINLSPPIIFDLAMRQLSGDVLNNSGGTVIHAMTQTASKMRDIGAISEALGLLSHYCMDAQFVTLEPSEALELNRLCIAATADHALFVLTIPIHEGELRYVAHWICDGLHSEQVAAMEGTLCLPFCIEAAADQDGELRLYPDWTACFYAKHNPQHGFPLLLANSMIESGQVPDDWVPVALHRLSSYQLPVSDAIQYIDCVSIKS